MIDPQLFIEKCADGYTVRNQEGQFAWEGDWREISNSQERKSRRICTVKPIIFAQPGWALGWIQCGCPGGFWPFVVFADGHDEALQQVATMTAYDVLAGRPLYPELQQMTWADFWRSTNGKAQMLYPRTAYTVEIEREWPSPEEIRREMDEERQRATSGQAIVHPLQKRETAVAAKKISGLLKEHLGKYAYQQGRYEQKALMERGDSAAKENYTRQALINEGKSQALSALLAEIEQNWEKW